MQFNSFHISSFRLVTRTEKQRLQVQGHAHQQRFVERVMIIYLLCGSDVDGGNDAEDSYRRLDGVRELSVEHLFHSHRRHLKGLSKVEETMSVQVTTWKEQLDALDSLC